MEKPSFEQQLLSQLEKISRAIMGISALIGRIDENNRFPIINPSEEMEKRLKEQAEEQRASEHLRTLESQNKILLRTVKIAIVGIIITALVGVADIILRIWGK